LTDKKADNVVLNWLKEEDDSIIAEKFELCDKCAIQVLNTTLDTIIKDEKKKESIIVEVLKKIVEEKWDEKI
jgi:hypothetical protein